MEKFFITFADELLSLFKKLWVWLVCLAIIIINGSFQDKIIAIIVLVIGFPLIAATTTLWIDKIRRERKPPEQ
ncbi:MAG: hypothetical protein HY813_02775 [Candidatus Portnoybacteria bacterium]|nr:hypothetical protein [Candidatus Portnoybacteria bacterium]